MLPENRSNIKSILMVYTLKLQLTRMLSPSLVGSVPVDLDLLNLEAYVEGDLHIKRSLAMKYRNMNAALSSCVNLWEYTW